MDYTVELAIRTARPLTERTLSRVAAVGGCATGKPGAKRIETVLTVTASSIPCALAKGIKVITQRVAGAVIAAEGMTMCEADRRSRAYLRANRTQSGGG